MPNRDKCYAIILNNELNRYPGNYPIRFFTESQDEDSWRKIEEIRPEDELPDEITLCLASQYTAVAVSHSREYRIVSEPFIPAMGKIYKIDKRQDL